MTQSSIAPEKRPWPDMLRLGLASGAEWIVVEQPPGNAAWEAEVSHDLARAGRHVAKLEFEARDVGAPYERRRVFLLSSPSLSRLEVAWQAGPRAIEQAARSADARGAWNPDQIESQPEDARSAAEHDRGPAKVFRKHRVESHSPKDALLDDVMRWVCEGKADVEIAIILGQPEKAVSSAVARFKHRHGVRTRVQAAVLFDRMERNG